MFRWFCGFGFGAGLFVFGWILGLGMIACFLGLGDACGVGVI